MGVRASSTTRGRDVIWIASVASLILVVVTSVVVTWATADNSRTVSTLSSPAHAQHAAAPSARVSHNDFFTNGGRYMPRTHCLVNEAGNPDWPWIIVLIVLCLGAVAAYARIYLFWCRSYFAEEPRDRNPRLMDLAQIFLWCAVCGYATSVLMFFWPGYRLIALCLFFLNIWSWRFCLNLSGFRTAFTADRYKRLSEHDPLTGLYSRNAIKQKLDDCLKRPEELKARPITLLFLDFDRFKLVNDSMGHEAGDDLLKQIAQRLKNVINDHDESEGFSYRIGRLGGDEFVVILDGTADAATVSRQVKRLQNELTCAYNVAGRAIHSSVSIGITSTDHGYATADEMLRDADTAMYEAKRAGRARSVWFDKAMHHAVRDAIELENDLRHAIERNELFLVYQPIINLEDGSVTGFETLIRWRHPQRGLVRPDQFIYIAEDSLLIRPIGRWVLDQALKQIRIWRDRFPELRNATMNVNLSRVQFADPVLTQYVLQSLQEHGLPYDALCLEITESTIMEDNDNAVALLQYFREQGIKLAMDDFGTGYSSLSHLHEFPLDALKIDKSFIANLSNNRDYAAVIQAITALAGNLGFTVVAEGVETVEQIAELQALSCHKGQGYFFHKPAEPPIIEAYLSQREQRSRDNALTA